MTAMLTTAERDKLVRVLGLTASPHDGERATAAAMASEMLRSRGLVWSDVILPPPVGYLGLPAAGPRRASGTPTPTTPASSWRAQIDLVLANAAMLTPWEMAFACSIGTRGRLTAKQADVLLRLCERLLAQGAR